MTRVLSIGHSYVLAANRTILRELAKDTSFDITVAAPTFFHGDLRPLAIEPEPEGSRLRIVGLRAFATRSIYVFAYHHGDLAALMREPFDVIHAWEEPYIVSGFQIAHAARGNDARFCFRTAQNNVKRYPPPFTFFERSVISQADQWIAGGHLVYEAMCRKGFPRDRGRVLTLSVDMSAFRPASPEHRRGVQGELGIEGPVIGFLGRFTEAKGVGVLLSAMERVGFQIPWSLLMLGSGPLEGKIHRWADRHRASERVHVRLVNHDEVPRILPAMDMMVAPSQTMKNWREQFGRMTIEAFAAGVPLITSDSGEIPRVAGDAAIVVPERDIDGYANAIRHLLTRLDERHALAQRGLERAQSYSSVRIASQYAEFYRSLASAPRVTR